MMKFKTLLISIVTPLLLAVMPMAPADAFNLFRDACSGDAANSPACQQAQNEGGANNNRVTGPKNIINVAANILALVTGVAAVIMIIIGGFTMVTSAGNSESVTAARRRIIGALVGLVVVALAWTIIRFATDKLIQ